MGDHLMERMTWKEVDARLQAGVDAAPLAAAWAVWRDALDALERARLARDGLERERERLQWQIGELARLEPAAGEWEEINTEHTRLAHAQALLEAARVALDAVSEAEPSADGLAGRAAEGLPDRQR